MKRFIVRFAYPIFLGFLITITAHAAGEKECANVKDAGQQELCTYVCVPGCTVEIEQQTGRMRVVGACDQSVSAQVRDAELLVLQGAANPLIGLPCVRVVTEFKR